MEEDGNNPETMREHRMAVQQTQGIDMPSLAQSMQRRKSMNKHSKVQGNADP